MLVQRWGRPLCNYLVRVVGRTDANDMWQQTWLKVWKALAPGGTYQLKGAFEAWLFRVGRNACMDHFRSENGRPTPLDDDDDSQQVFDSIPSRELSPEDAARIGEWREIILACMDECLSPKFRAAFVLVDMEEKAFHEAALELHIPTGTVMSRVGRARIRMRECLRRRGIEL
jgi:RNA polymerase sigma-70 factor (ECF subfamily)